MSEVEKKIRQCVYLHGVWLKTLRGTEIDGRHERDLMFKEYQEGLLTVENIQEDIEEYKNMLEMFGEKYETST